MTIFPKFILVIFLKGADLNLQGCKHNLDLLLRTDKPIVMCDLDVIIEKDIKPIIDLPFDIIISTEIGGSKSYPKECSSVLGFGVCCGFMVLKPTAKK